MLKPQSYTPWLGMGAALVWLANFAGCADTGHYLYHHTGASAAHHHDDAYYHCPHCGRVVPKHGHRCGMEALPNHGYQPTCWTRFPMDWGCPAPPYEEIIEPGRAAADPETAPMPEPAYPQGSSAVTPREVVQSEVASIPKVRPLLVLSRHPSLGKARRVPAAARLTEIQTSVLSPAAMAPQSTARYGSELPEPAFDVPASSELIAERDQPESPPAAFAPPPVPLMLEPDADEPSSVELDQTTGENANRQTSPKPVQVRFVPLPAWLGTSPDNGKRR